MNKILVAYFSATGTTASAAENLAKAAKADIAEIKPAVPYTAADLNWQDKSSRSSVEMNDKGSRPEIVPLSADISSYDTIFLCFPIWWYTAPTIVKTFLESADFSGKKIVLFATSGSSNLGKTAADLKEVLPDSAVVKDGRMINGAPSVDALTKWLQTQSL
jgi:flavodoxin